MNTYRVTFDADSPVKVADFVGDGLKYPDGSGEHSHALVLRGDKMSGSFDLERAVTVQVIATDD